MYHLNQARLWGEENVISGGSVFCHRPVIPESILIQAGHKAATGNHEVTLCRILHATAYIGFVQFLCYICLNPFQGKAMPGLQVCLLYTSSIKPLLDQALENFNLNLSHELGPDFPQTVVPHNVELGILLLQLAQLW